MNIVFFSYREKFGYYHVDFNSPAKTRTAKTSAKVYANIIRTHSIDWNFQPEPPVIAEPHSSANSSPTTIAVLSPFLVLCTAFTLYYL